MTYYIIEISKGDSKIEGKSMYEYTDRVKAEASYYKKIGTAMGSDLYTEHRIALMSDALAIEMAHVYVKESAPTAQTEEEAEE